MSRKANKINLLEVVPVADRNITIAWSEEGSALLSFPRFRNKWIQTYLLPKRIRSHITVELENFGTSIWNQIDGKNTVSDIINYMLTEYPEEEQMQDRVVKYIKQLFKDKFIKLFSPQ